MPALNALAAATPGGQALYSDLVHFVNVYVIEPHPADPDPSPYRGTVWETPPVSDRRQPRTLAERMGLAREVRPLIAGNQIQVVDDLRPDVQVNPFWCTYGTAPNAAYLIRKDGTFHTVQTWFNAPAMEAALRNLLGF